MEYWDLYDEYRNPLGRTHKRGDEMVKGEFHIVVEVWTVNSKKEILTTFRDSSKKDYPDKWECTGGSILSGESSKQGAVRELQEETGIAAKEDELILLGTYIEHSAFIDIYMLHRDAEIENLIMQEGETAGAKWNTVEEILTMINDKTLALPTGLRFKHVEDMFLANL